MKKEMPSVRELKNEDIPNVIELLNMVFSELGYFETPMDNSWWKWRYELSPFGQPIHLVAENSSGNIVGFRSFWPWELIFKGLTLKAYQPQATVVHPSFRRMGIFREMNLEALNRAKKEGADLLFNFPNQASLPGYLSMGWHFVSKIPWLVKPLRPLAIVSSFFSRDKARPLELGKNYALKEKHCLELTDSEAPNGFIRTKVSPEFFKWRYLDHPFFHYGFHSFSSGDKWMSGIFSVVQKDVERKCTSWICPAPGIPLIFRPGTDSNSKRNGSILYRYDSGKRLPNGESMETWFYQIPSQEHDSPCVE